MGAESASQPEKSITEVLEELGVGYQSAIVETAAARGRHESAGRQLHNKLQQELLGKPIKVWGKVAHEVKLTEQGPIEEVSSYQLLGDVITLKTIVMRECDLGHGELPYPYAYFQNHFGGISGAWLHVGPFMEHESSWHRAQGFWPPTIRWQVVEPGLGIVPDIEG